MATHDAPRKAYQFFRERLLTEKTFTYSELTALTGWKRNTIDSYMTKHWREVIGKQKGGFRVKPAFQYLSESRFLASFTQARKFFVDYERVKYEELVQYELLLPLTQEGQLRKALDELFYEDTILRRLKDIGMTQVQKWIEPISGEPAEDYNKRVCQTVSTKFQGYSISHVSGRYLAGDLATRSNAAGMLAKEESYIIDETTAAVRFIIPLGTTKRTITGDFGKAECNEEVSTTQETSDEVSLVHWLFFNVFAEAIVRTVEGEDVIWLIEETPRKRRLYVWQKEDKSEEQKNKDSKASLLPLN